MKATNVLKSAGIVCGMILLTGPQMRAEEDKGELTPDSRITSVMLAGGQAIVSRTGRVKLPPGKSTLVFQRLPVTLTDSSLRFGVSTEDRILDIRLDQVTTTEIPDEEARAAEENLRAAQARLRELTDEYKTLGEMESFARGISADPSEKKWDEKSDRLSPAQWRRSIEFVESTIDSVHAEQRDLRKQMEAAEEDVQVALVVAERLLSRRNLVTKQARVTVQSSGREADFNLSYRTPGADWYPVYSVRVGRAEKEAVKLSAFALVQNRTGEQWDNVKLQLSASNPEDLISLPELREWRIRAAMIAEQNINDATSDKRRQNISPAAPAREMQRQSMDEEAQAPGKPSYAPQTQTNQVVSQLPADNKPVNDELNKTVSNSRNTLKESQGITSGKDASLLSVLNSRDRAFQDGDYDGAAKYSEEFMGKLGKLRNENQKYFATEEKKSREIREKSLTALQNRTNNLIAPRALRGAAIYETQYSETIPSDGILRKVSLFDSDLQAERVYECAPMHQAFGYLTGHVQYKNDKPLLPGPAQIFYGDDFTGEAVLPETGNNQKIALSLGSTEDIKVTRTENRFRESAGLLGGDLRYKIEVQIKIKNSRREMIVLDVFDRVPRSEDDRIKIEETGLTPAPVERTPEGLARFRLNIGPGAEQIVTLKYTLRHSAEITPSGVEAGPAL
ncbi:MAG: mucoidy inhibitor MuiA family protein [Leptospirales bacterium]|nr:mucoidy inhibitor MuiA family protein [Leptospirales bacterium]